MKGGYNFSFPTLLHFPGELLLTRIRYLSYRTSNTNVTVPLRDEFNRNEETKTSKNERITMTNGRSMKYRNTDNGIISTFVKLTFYGPLFVKKSEHRNASELSKWFRKSKWFRRSQCFEISLNNTSTVIGCSLITCPLINFKCCYSCCPLLVFC